MITTITAQQPMQKTYTREGSTDYARAYLVRGQQHEVNDIVDLYDLLEELESDPYRCVVRGRPITPNHWVRRTYRQESEPGFIAQDLDWLCLDVDGAPLLEGADWHKPWIFAAQYLPECLREAGCVYQWSSSAGIKPGLRAHYWFLLDRPVCDASLRAWVKSLGGFDAGLYQPVQPHYTARPAFDGVANPIRQRLFMRLGPRAGLPDEVCALAQWQVLERERIEAARSSAEAMRARERLFRPAHELQGRYERAALKRAVEAITGALEGERHDTIRKESWSTYRFVREGRLDEQLWYDTLHDAATHIMPASRHHEVDRLLQSAKKAP